jgi:hypothetical protein
VEPATSTEDRALIAELLSLPNDGRYPQLALDAQQKRRLTLQALQTQLEALAGQRPVLLIFEDAHWIDPSSLELLGLVVERIRSIPVLLIVTAGIRPALGGSIACRERDAQSTWAARGGCYHRARRWQPGVVRGRDGGDR